MSRTIETTQWTSRQCGLGCRAGVVEALRQQQKSHRLSLLGILGGAATRTRRGVSFVDQMLSLRRHGSSGGQLYQCNCHRQAVCAVRVAGTSRVEVSLRTNLFSVWCAGTPIAGLSTIAHESHAVHRLLSNHALQITMSARAVGGPPTAQCGGRRVFDVRENGTFSVSAAQVVFWFGRGELQQLVRGMCLLLSLLA